MNVINILLGFVILLTGRQLFWLFVGILGFLAGASLAQEFISTDPVWMVWLLAAVLGLIGALLAVFLQRVAVTVAGFIAGWVFVTNLAATFGWEFGNLTWVLFLIGGVIGSFLINILYDGALIFLSSIVGATTIVQNLNLNLDPFVTSVALIILILVGVSVQYRAMLIEQGAVVVRERSPV
jgi:hypothetical protein